VQNHHTRLHDHERLSVAQSQCARNESDTAAVGAIAPSKERGFTGRGDSRNAAGLESRRVEDDRIGGDIDVAPFAVSLGSGGDSGIVEHPQSTGLDVDDPAAA
jgi:hypothetical protein